MKEKTKKVKSLGIFSFKQQLSSGINFFLPLLYQQNWFMHQQQKQKNIISKGYYCLNLFQVQKFKILKDTLKKAHANRKKIIFVAALMINRKILV